MTGDYDMAKKNDRTMIKEKLSQAINASIKVRELLTTIAMFYGDDYQEYMMIVYQLSKLYGELEDKLKQFDKEFA